MRTRSQEIQPGKWCLAGWLLALLAAGHPAIPIAASTEGFVLGPRESANLGISLIQPRRSDLLTTIDAMAKVVVPPESDVAVGALLSGVVSRLYVGTGDRVTRGQPLAALTSLQFLTLQSDYLDALGMQALTEAAQIRDETLHEEGIISQRRLSETRTAAAEAELHLAEQRQLLTMNGLTPDEVKQLTQHRKLFEALIVRSPANGEVLARWIGAGDQVAAGATLFRIADLSQLWLEIQLPAESIPVIAPGLVVTHQNSVMEQALARITMATRVVDPGSQKVMVRAETIHASHNLLPGQRIEVTIHVPGTAERGRTTWEIPARAITRHSAQAYVFARTTAGFEAVSVTVSGGNGEIAYVEADLTDQSRIALTGIAALKAIWLTANEGE